MKKLLRKIQGSTVRRSAGQRVWARRNRTKSSPGSSQMKHLAAKRKLNLTYTRGTCIEKAIQERRSTSVDIVDGHLHKNATKLSMNILIQGNHTNVHIVARVSEGRLNWSSTNKFIAPSARKRNLVQTRRMFRTVTQLILVLGQNKWKLMQRHINPQMAALAKIWALHQEYQDKPPNMMRKVMWNSTVVNSVAKLSRMPAKG